MRADDLHGQHIKPRRAAGSGTAMGAPVAGPGVRPATRRFLDRYPVLCLLASCTAGLALVIAALAAVLLLAVGGVCAFAPLVMCAASDAPWLFPEDSERE